MKQLIFLIVFGLVSSATATSHWLIIENNSNKWTSTLPYNVKLMNWDNENAKMLYRYKKWVIPSKFPAFLCIEEPTKIVYDFNTIDQAKDMLENRFLSSGPKVTMQAVEAPYVVLNSENDKGIGIATTEDGDLYTWREHSSPWNVDIASANRVAALKARHDLYDNMWELKDRIDHPDDYIEESLARSTRDISTNDITTLQLQIEKLTDDVNQLRKIVGQLMKEQL